MISGEGMNPIAMASSVFGKSSLLYVEEWCNMFYKQ